LTACDFETSNNGDLDGYWQLKQVDTLATGGSADMRTSGLFWSVQVNLLETRDNKNANINIYWRFEKTGDRLRIWNPIANNRAISDSIVKDPATCAGYYIQATPMADGNLESVLLINKLNSDDMVLSNNSYRLHFRKY
jgi:hypothetical protein